jgi:VanZ family protein
VTSRRFIRLWLPVLLYMGVIFYLSSLPEAPLPEGMSDKSGHSLGYFGLGVVVMRAVAGGLPARITARGALLTLAIAVGYGASDELHQLFVPGRFADAYDLLADFAGALAAIVGCWLWGILFLRSRP